MKFFSPLISFTLVIASLLASGCGRDNPPRTAQPMIEPMTETVTIADYNEGTISFNKETALDKDLILGGEIRDIATTDGHEGLGELIMEFLPTILVRLELDKSENSPRLRLVRSPYVPQGRQPLHFPRQLGTLNVKTTKDNRVEVDAKEFLKLLSENSVADAGFSTELARFNGDLASVDENHLILPMEVTIKVSEISAAVSFVLYLKRWEPKETLRRTIHKDFGYFTLFEWGQWGDTEPYQVRARRSPEDPILAWDLENHSKPIEYIITDSVPEEYRQLFIEAIEAWNIPFRQAGIGHDVVRARVENEGEVPLIGDPRVHLVYWERSLTKGIPAAHASFQVDPITGEMYHANVYFGGASLLRALRESYERYYAPASRSDRQAFEAFQQTRQLFPAERPMDRQQLTGVVRDILSPSSSESPLRLSFAHIPFVKACDYSYQGDLASSPASSEVRSAEDFVRAWLLEVMIHEVGHNWGLRHNFKGSLGVHVADRRRSNSVMDYNDDSLAMTGLFMNAPGVYDEKAIAYGYSKERPSELEDIPYPFCTDEDASDALSPDFDPRCTRWDSGANPLQDSLIEDLNKYYVKLLLAESVDEKGRIFRRFRTTAITSLLYLSRLGTREDKSYLNAAIAELADLKEVTLPGETDPRNLTTEWLYDELRPLLVDVSLFLASLFTESDDTLHDSLLGAARCLITASPDGAPNMSPETRERLIDDLYSFRAHPDHDIQLQAWNTLSQIENALRVERLALENQTGSDPFRLADVTRFATLTRNRMETFFGRRLGPRR